MALKIVCDMRTLMKYAYDLGQARLSKDPERIAEAKEKHDSYKRICLDADEIRLGMTRGKLDG